MYLLPFFSRSCPSIGVRSSNTKRQRQKRFKSVSADCKLIRLYRAKSRIISVP